MKTKLLSTLMLMACTAMVFVGCGGKKEKAISVDTFESVKADNKPVYNAEGKVYLVECSACDASTHTIPVNNAKDLILEFHRRYIDVANNRINNIGGIIDLSNWRVVPSGNPGFRPLKMHYGLDESRNLVLTVETNNQNCDQGVYQGELSVESDNLLTSNSHFNPIVTGKLTTSILTDFLSKPLTISANVYSIPKDRAIGLYRNFEMDFSDVYPCPDIHFYPAHSIDEIFKVTKNRKFAYFFGYDDNPAAECKIRVILVGIDDSTGRLKLIDGQNNSLMRDYSRPHPFTKSKP